MSTDPHNLNDDALDPDEPFDARQHAMHGLLRAHFEDRPTSDERVRRILDALGMSANSATRNASTELDAARLAVGGDHRRRQRAGALRLTWLWTSGAAAAVLFTAVVAYVALLSPAPAVADQLRDLALQPSRVLYLSLNVDAILAADRFRPGRIACDIEAQLALRDRALPAAESGDVDATNTAYQAWANAYRAMRTLGHWDEAILEMYALAEHAAQFHTPEGAPSPWPHIALYDVGETYLALGELTAAQQAYTDSLALREMYVQFSGANASDANRLADLLNTILPVYWRFSDMALAEGDAALAQNWLDRGDPLLRAYFAGVCRASNVDVPANAGALDIYERFLPQVFREPPEEGYEVSDALRIQALYRGFIPFGAHVAKLRGQVYRAARLKRLTGELGPADSLLWRAWKLRDYPTADEERLAYVIPLEFARLEIARDDWPAAEPWLEKARIGTAAVVAEWDHGLDKPEISGVGRTDLTLLSALVAMKLNPDDPAGQELLDTALASVDALAAQLDVTQSKRFLDQFRAWRELVRF